MKFSKLNVDRRGQYPFPICINLNVSFVALRQNSPLNPTGEGSAIISYAGKLCMMQKVSIFFFLFYIQQAYFSLKSSLVPILHLYDYLLFSRTSDLNTHKFRNLTVSTLEHLYYEEELAVL